MSLLTEDAWALSQRGCDRCPVCQRDPVLMATDPTPARPWWPEHTGRLVLISEAPPVSGEMCEVPIGQARGKSFAIAIAGRSIPLDVALLPVDQNMRRGGEAALIRDDIAKFVTRHRSD